MFKEDTADIPKWFHENQYTSLFVGVWLKLVQRDIELYHEKKKLEAEAEILRQYREGEVIDPWASVKQMQILYGVDHIQVPVRLA